MSLAQPIFKPSYPCPNCKPSCPSALLGWRGTYCTQRALANSQHWPAGPTRGSAKAKENHQSSRSSRHPLQASLHRSCRHVVFARLASCPRNRGHDMARFMQSCFLGPSWGQTSEPQGLSTTVAEQASCVSFVAPATALLWRLLWPSKRLREK